jgi:hypothetical protein
MTVITMSRTELTRLRVLIHVADGRLSVADATGLIAVERRRVHRCSMHSELPGRKSIDFAHAWPIQPEHWRRVS